MHASAPMLPHADAYRCDVQKGEGLSGELPSFANAAELRVLRMGGNALTGPLPDLPFYIQEVRLHQNMLSGSIPDSYHDLPDLHTLKIEHNQVTGPLMPGEPPMYSLYLPESSAHPALHEHFAST